MRYSRIDLPTVFAICLAAILFAAPPADAQLFDENDIVIAIDLDGDSLFPFPENPASAVDQDPASKYLNFGAPNTGLIITPQFGSSVIRSLQLTTANDAPERDPTAFALYGTNSSISTPDNGLSDENFWTLIAEGPIALPNERFAASEIVDFSNSTSYTSYRLIFTEVNSAEDMPIMQVGDVQLFTDVAGGGMPVLQAFDFAIAVTIDPLVFSFFPSNDESAPSAFDNDVDTKYLNFGITNSGFIVARSDGESTILDGFTITTANDFPGRDPASYIVSGTNSPLTSGVNSTGDEENWIDVATGDLTLPMERFTVSDPVAFVNNTSYSAYRVVFPTVAGAANSMQISEFTFSGKIGKPSCLIGDVNGDGMVTLLDVGPFVEAITGNNFLCEADINEDGVVDLLDVGPFVAVLTGG